MFFQNRKEAAELLAKKLAPYRGQNPLILAIPRGAVPMAHLLADSLEGEIDVALAHKLRAPGRPELAIGSVDGRGHVYLDERVRAFGANAEYIAGEKAVQMKTLRQRRAKYGAARAPIDPAGRIVIVVDDGIATGASMIAALRAVRTKRPAKLIAAAPVSSEQAFRAIEATADEVVCLAVPEDFYAVGQFYLEFDQVSDEEVVSILSQSRRSS